MYKELLILLMLSLCAGCASDTASSPAEPVLSSASWESSARTVADAAAEADLVVRARVIAEPLSRPQSFEGVALDANGTPTTQTHSTRIVFADTLVEVVSSYKGDAPPQLLVMQTGGRTDSGEIAQFADDPLYRVGEEYMLFLVDISDDAVHAQGRKLYRIVSPVGRFLLDGESATSFAAEYMNQQLPTSAIELERQIQLAVGS